jgi:hypothetical protein
MSFVIANKHTFSFTLLFKSHKFMDIFFFGQMSAYIN